MPEQHHPWKRLRDELPDWHVEFVTLPPGVAGETDHDRKVISIGRHLDQAGRRSTLTHEALHVAREHLDPTEHDEVDVEQMAAIILMPIGRLLEVLVWARNSYEAAEELWVDHALFLTRMRHLGPPERRAIDNVLRARDYYETA